MKTNILHTVNLSEAVNEIKNNGGHVTQICTQNIMISNFPDDFDMSTLNLSTSSIPEGIDEMSMLFVDAWNLDIHDKDVEVKNWDDEGGQYPHNRFNDEELASQYEIFPPSQSSYMVGEITVGLVIVDSVWSELKFSNSQIHNTISQTLSGMQSLASFEPLANITFKYVTRILDISARPNSSCITKESCEKIWRDPALKMLGVKPGLSGVTEYNNFLIQESVSQWAFMAFITKYPLGHFAYAGSGRICLEYSNGGWGPGQINKVLAHETGHIFGAADEYSDSDCTCKKSGFYRVPNYNCDNCSSNFPKVNCLMKQNDLTNICQFSRGQLGWNYTIDSGQSTADSPSLTSFNDLLYCAFKSNDSSNKLLIMISEDGINWSSHKLTNQTTSAAPALAVFNNKLYCAFKSDDPTNRILIINSSDGFRWSENSATQQYTSAAPSLAVLNDELYCAFKSNDPSNRILITKSKDGILWSENNETNQTSSAAPSLAVMNNFLYCVFKSNDSSNRILSIFAFKGSGWSVNSETGQTTAAAPSLTLLKNTMYCAFLSNDPTNRVLITKSLGANRWSENTNTGQNTSAGPSLVAFNDGLFCAFKSNESSNEIMNSSLIFNL